MVSQGRVQNRKEVLSSSKILPKEGLDQARHCRRPRATATAATHLRRPGSLNPFGNSRCFSLLGGSWAILALSWLILLSKMLLRSSKTPSRRPQEPPRRPQDHPSTTKMPSRGAKKPSKKAQEASKTGQEASKSAQDPPRRPKILPKWRQVAPKSFENRPYLENGRKARGYCKTNEISMIFMVSGLTFRS